MKRVTVKEARNILGDEATEMSDDEVRSLIDDLSVMAKWALEEAVRLRAQNTPDITTRSKNDSTEL